MPETVTARRSAPRARPLAVFVSVLLAFAPGRVGADTYPRQPVDVLHYDVAISFLDDFVYAATTRLDVRVRADGLSEVRLDFDGPHVDRVKAHERPLGFRSEAGRLVIDLGRPHASGEIVSLLVEYHGRPDGKGLVAGTNGHRRPILFADNWPEGARRWIPSIDHPSDKATVELAVTAPDRFDVVAPGRLVETRSLLDGRRTTRWSEDVPIPTYCMVIGLAEFDVTYFGEADGVPLTAWVFPPDRDTALRRLARAGLVLERFADLLGPFPYEKLAHVQSSTRWGAVEYASAIFYSEKQFRGAEASDGAMPHETAHQWWGDSVTPADWDDVWLSEGFATYFDALFHEQVEGPAALRDRMARAAEAVRKRVAEKPGSVIDPSVTDPAAKLSPLTYQKGAWVLHMLRHRLGDEAFFAGLRAFYRTHAGGNATTDDLRHALEAASGQPLDGFFLQWLHRADLPELRVTWSWDGSARRVVVEIEQTQPGEPYVLDLELAFRLGAETERRSVALRERRESVSVDLPAAPGSIDVDPDGWSLHTATVVPAAPRAASRD